MPSPADKTLWTKERQYLAQLEKEKPDLFQERSQVSIQMLREQIGLIAPLPARQKAFVKYSPLDFIVEEIRQNGEVILADAPVQAPKEAATRDEARGVFVDLVKVGLSTIDAAQRLGDAFKIETKSVGYAGVKDSRALTAQRISLRGIRASQLEGVSVPNIWLRNAVEGKGVIATGELSGNRFTLLLRTEGAPNEAMFSSALDRVKQHGVYNYYGAQRFGSPRYLAHLFGAHILRGDVEACIRAYLTEPSPFEQPVQAELRRQAATKWGNWEAMLDILHPLPSSFKYEHVFLQSLMLDASPKGFRRALEAVSTQAKMWVMAYASYLANHALSEMEIGTRAFVQKLPLLISNEPSAAEPYRALLKAHNMESWLTHLKTFPYLLPNKTSMLETRIDPKIRGWKAIPEGIVLGFDLQKGAYATTVLDTLFDVAPPTPIPSWVLSSDVDTKMILQEGSLTEIKTQFAEALSESMVKQSEEGEEKL